MKSQLSILDPATVSPTPVSPTLTSSTPATITLKPAAVQREVQNLLNSGALRDFNWPADQIRKNALDLWESWKIAQAGMQRTISPITYVQLKDEKRKHYKSVLENATATNLDAFTLITSAAEHHSIIDDRGVILGYRCRIPQTLLATLSASSSQLPCTRVDAGIHGQYPTRHYAVWKEYASKPHLSSEYKKDLPASANWCELNRALFTYLSNTLQCISPQTYARYSHARQYLKKKHKPLCGVWYGVAINQDVTGDTKTHQDWGDHGYNCVVPWGEYEKSSLVLWQLKMVVELQLGDAFFFMGSLIAHNVQDVKGVRNSIDLFCHHTVLSWKEKCKEKRRNMKSRLRRGKKLSLRQARKLKSVII